jgi:TPP-dependent indolepyruvate ferredoxin oxidoreductase alpha subunit
MFSKPLFDEKEIIMTQIDAIEQQYKEAKTTFAVCANEKKINIVTAGKLYNKVANLTLLFDALKTSHLKCDIVFADFKKIFEKFHKLWIQTIILLSKINGSCKF